MTKAAAWRGPGRNCSKRCDPGVTDKDDHWHKVPPRNEHLLASQPADSRGRTRRKLHDQEPKGTKCPAIDGIIKEGDDLMGEVEGEDVMNVGIVAAAQAVEHYEITRYGALIAWAKELGHDQDAAILGRSLEEEKTADRKLTAIAERRVNRVAPSPGLRASGHLAPGGQRFGVGGAASGVEGFGAAGGTGESARRSLRSPAVLLRSRCIKTSTMAITTAATATMLMIQPKFPRSARNRFLALTWPRGGSSDIGAITVAVPGGLAGCSARWSRRRAPSRTSDGRRRRHKGR
jgi:hypothetical protein